MQTYSSPLLSQKRKSPVFPKIPESWQRPYLGVEVSLIPQPHALVILSFTSTMTPGDVLLLRHVGVSYPTWDPETFVDFST